MLRLTDLPANVLNEVFVDLDQSSLINLNSTCKSLYELCCRPIYTNIYITDENFDFEVNIKSTDHHNWSIIRNSLKPGGCLKKFERTLTDNPTLIRFIRRIMSDDFHFILFKLKFWGKRFFIRENNLNYVYLSKIPKTQVSTTYRELYSFYCNKSLSLQELQLRSIDELVKLSFSGNLDNIQYISFDLIDESNTHTSNIKIDSHTRKRLISVLSKLKGLKIYSLHNGGLSFLLLLQKLFVQKTLFHHLREFEINHLHKRSLEYENLRFAILRSVMNFSNIEKLSIQVDCENIYRTTIERYDFDIFKNSGYCTCLELFFEDFSNCIDTFESLRHFTVIKAGETVLDNPFSMYYFKFHMASLLPSLKNIKYLSLDTKSVVFPIHNFMGNETFTNMVHLFREQNSEILLKLNNMTLERLRLVDYFESFHIWDLATLGIGKDNLNYYCQCTRCETTKHNIIKFLEVNEKIQFYLDPASYNVFLSFYFDLISTLLSYLKNGSVTKWLIDSIIHNASYRSELQTTTLVSSISEEVHLSHHRFLDLHKLYRHHNYKNSIDFRSMEVLRTPKIEVPCSCNGSEFTQFIHFISHQLSEGVFSCFDYSCDLYLNTFPCIFRNRSPSPRRS